MPSSAITAGFHLLKLYGGRLQNEDTAWAHFAHKLRSDAVRS